MYNIQYIWIFISLSLLGCAQKSLKHIPGKQITLGIDLRQYTVDGFLVTPFQYQADYMAVGMIYTTFMPEGIKTKIKTDKKTDDGMPIHKKVWRFQNLKLQDGLDKMVADSKELGADAIVELKIQDKTESHIDGFSAINVYGYELSGFAIKRKGAFKESTENFDLNKKPTSDTTFQNVRPLIH